MVWIVALVLAIGIAASCHGDITPVEQTIDDASTPDTADAGVEDASPADAVTTSDV